MTVSDGNASLDHSDDAILVKKSDLNQNFLRAARAGNLSKVLDLLGKQCVDLHACNMNGLNALHLASKEGHVEVVSELLSRGADPDRATKKGNTSLHIASLAGQFEVVKTLIDFGADVNTQAQNGFTPLYMAAQENHLEVVKLLLAKNADPTLTTDDGFTPLAVALQQGHDRIVALLLEHDSHGRICLPALHIAAKKDDVKAASLLLNSDVNVNHQSTSGFTALHIAAHYGNINMTELLISRGADINFQAKNNITPLHVACKWGNHGVTERLIAAGAELDCRTRDGLTPLHCAARSGHDVVVQLLLGTKASFNVKTRSGLNALHMAAQGDHVDVARLLLQRGIPVDDVTIDYLTALHVASHCGTMHVARLLIACGCDVNARALNGFTPLHVACQKNRVKMVDLLLKSNCLLETTTESGLTPLHVAAFMGHLEIAVMLLQHGANPNTPTVHNETTLHLAARAGQVEIARLLIRNGAQVDARAQSSQTPLHIVSRTGNAELVSLLLEHSAHVQAAAKGGYTPLHIAAKANHRDVCDLLLQAGAEADTQTRSGFTPLHLATKHLNTESVALLLTHGADVNAVGRNGLTPLHLATHYGSVHLVRLLLDHNANPLAQAKNGFTPLHIAAEKHMVAIAEMLISATKTENSCDVESRNGFTALHLASQDGCTEMVHLLLAAGANVNARAKNGLTPMHLAAQEDSVNAATLLHSAGSELDVKTKAGYTPLHTACHFGQTNMVRFLLGKRVNVNAQTCLGSNALHLAAQQGHSKVVYILLEGGADPNMRNKYNWTPAHVARRQHYLNIFEVLRQVTTCVQSWEVEDDFESRTIQDGEAGKSSQLVGTRQLLEQPDMMGDHPVTDTEESYEPDYTVIPMSPIFSRSDVRHPSAKPSSSATHKIALNGTSSRGPLDKMSNMSGEDSIHENLVVETNHLPARYDGLGADRQPSWNTKGIGQLFERATATADLDFAPDNVPILRKPMNFGFLVSFLVDARGGSMRGSRHPGLRVLVPPGAASAPTRVTCRMLRPERTTRPPQLNDSEGLACRLLELGPHPCIFNSPVLLEIPHFASLRGRQRELVVLRSDNGETWREHSLEATDQAVQSALGQSFDTLETLEELREKRIIRILTNDFPQYLAIVSRLRQETALIGSDGGVLSSTVVPQVQAVFPEGALQKRIRVGLQAQSIPADLVTRLLGSRVSVSPIVTLEPRRRKFHKPITLTIPLPKSAHRAMINPASNQTVNKVHGAPSLRLLCSITGGTLPAQWEDITVPTPLSKVKDCVSFTTTVSARFWLLDCPNLQDSTELARLLYHEASLVPYMGKFVVFSKRLDADEALIRSFCITDDKVDKTLECQEGFEVCAASPEVEVIEGQSVWLEAAGNLLPVTKSGEQLSLHFNAFRENRLAFPVRVKDSQAEQTGKLAFMNESRAASAMVTNAEVSGSSQGMTVSQKPICTLKINLASGFRTMDTQSTDVGLLGLSNQLNSSVAASLHSIPCVFPQPLVDGTETAGQQPLKSDSRLAALYANDVIARSQLDLLQVACEVGADWPRLASVLVPDSGLDATSSVEQLVEWIVQNEPRWHGVDASAAAIGGGGFSGLTVGELRSSRDQALALLLAWKEHRGDAATGNELDRALRTIGRMDVSKSCMRDIQCVTDESEHIEASRRIDQDHLTRQAECVLSEPVSTSLVGTVTLMSGMDDLPGDYFGGADELKDVPQTTKEADTLMSVSPNSGGDEEKLLSPDDVEPGALTPKSDEPSTHDELSGEYNEDQWQLGSAPATTTSQQGGDPLLVRTGHELITDENTDIVRESESMTASLEERVDEEIKEIADVAIVSGDLGESVTRGLVPGEEMESSVIIAESITEHTHGQPLLTNVISLDGSLPNEPSALEDCLMDAHHTGGEVPASELNSAPMKHYNEEPLELTKEEVVTDLQESHVPLPEVQESLLSDAHHGVVMEETKEHSVD